jgi:hypothetical protein
LIPLRSRNRFRVLRGHPAGASEQAALARSA